MIQIIFFEWFESFYYRILKIKIKNQNQKLKWIKTNKKWKKWFKSWFKSKFDLNQNWFGRSLRACTKSQTKIYAYSRLMLKTIFFAAQRYIFVGISVLLRFSLRKTKRSIKGKQVERVPLNLIFEAFKATMVLFEEDDGDLQRFV